MYYFEGYGKKLLCMIFLLCLYGVIDYEGSFFGIIDCDRYNNSF